MIEERDQAVVSRRDLVVEIGQDQGRRSLTNTNTVRTENTGGEVTVRGQPVVGGTRNLPRNLRLSLTLSKSKRRL